MIATHHRMVGVVLALALTSCRSGDGEDAILLPRPNEGFDYQLGGSYQPPANVGIVARDRTAEPAPGLYNICYVNGFQTQPDEAEFWTEHHPDLLLRGAGGAPVVDPAFPDEMILDTSTREQRATLVEIVGAWIDGCADAGFDAVELDNLDTFERFPKKLSEEAAVLYVRVLADRAHDEGLAIAQKNSVVLAPRRGETAFDFAIVEQCNECDECQRFTDSYGRRVFVIEYDRGAFDQGCADHPELAIVFRDPDLSSPGSASYAC